MGVACEGLELRLEIVVSVHEHIVAVADSLEVFLEMLDLHLRLSQVDLPLFEGVGGLLTVLDLLVLLSEHFLLHLDQLVISSLHLIDLNVQ